MSPKPLHEPPKETSKLHWNQHSDPRNWPAIHDCVLPVVTPNQPCFYMPLWFATVHTRIMLSKMVLLQSQFFTRKEIAAEDMCMQPCDFKFPASERGLYQLTSENLPPSTYSLHFSPSTSFHGLVSKSSPQPTIASFLCKAIKACFRKGISSPRVAFHCIPRPKLLIIAWPNMTQVDLPSTGLFVTIDDDNWRGLQIAVAPFFWHFLKRFTDDGSRCTW